MHDQGEGGVGCRHGRPTSASTIAAELTTPERILLFCLASGTQRARITQAKIPRTLVHGLVERDTVGRLSLTTEGRAVFDALIRPHA